MHWLRLLLCVVLLATVAPQSHAQRVTVLFDSSGSIGHEVDRSGDPRDKRLKTVSLSRQSSMIAFVADVIRTAGLQVRIVPWNGVTFPAFPLPLYERSAAKTALRIGLPRLSDMTQLGEALRSLPKRRTCSIYVVLTDEVPDDKEAVQAILPRLLEAAPVGVFLVKNPSRDVALRYFNGLSASPRYTVAHMEPFPFHRFIEGMLDEVSVCPIA